MINEQVPQREMQKQSSAEHLGQVLCLVHFNRSTINETHSRCFVCRELLRSSLCEEAAALSSMVRNRELVMGGWSPPTG